MNPTSIYSKTGKGVQEASGKTSLLSRADRAVLTQIDGKTTFADLQIKFYKIDAAKLEALVLQLDKDGFVREVATSGSQPAATAPTPPPPAAARPAAAKPAAPPKDPAEELDFTAVPTRRPAAPGAGAPPARAQADHAAEARLKAEAWA
jgi:ribosomal protein L12E/L44/L45/RPP1/RPP2